MKKYIALEKFDKEWIASSFAISLRMVELALQFDAKRGNSDLAKRIRKLALERGGVMMTELPTFETLHNANGEMRQEFENGASIVADLNTGTVCVYDKERKLCRKVEQCTLEQLGWEQLFAARL